MLGRQDPVSDGTLGMELPSLHTSFAKAAWFSILADEKEAGPREL